MGTAVLRWSDIRNYADLVGRHLAVHWITYAVAWIAAVMFQDSYRLGINQSPSLPQTIFLIHKHELPRKGDYVAFLAPSTTNFRSGSILTKIVVGTEGDVVSVDDRIVRINMQAAGFAKPKSRKGETLEPIEPSVLGAGQFYVMGLHRDSFDSRYRALGLVSVGSIVGRAYPIW